MTFRRTTCPHCRAKLEAGQRIHPACIDGFAEAQAAKAARTAVKEARAAAKVERADIKRRKEALKRIPDYIRAAQIAFNAFVRARDAGQPCICCGRISSGAVHGGDFDAGHYRSRGSAPHLRFDERNVHAQLKQCNRYDSGNVVGYRMGLIERIGLTAVEALEADQEPRRHSIDDLKAIKADYTARAKELRA